MVDASIPFDYYQMQQYLKEIGTYLAELRYIDQVFTYMDKAESGWWDTAVDGVLSAGTSGGDDIRVDFTGTVPFSRTWRVPAIHLLWQDSAAEEARNKIAEFRASASAWASDNKLYRDLDAKVQETLSRMDHIRDTPDGDDGRLVPAQPRLLDGANSSDVYLPEAR